MRKIDITGAAHDMQHSQIEMENSQIVQKK